MDRREKVAYLFTLNDDQADEIEGDKYLRKGADFEIEEDVLNCGEMNENIPITSPITPTAPTPPILSQKHVHANVDIWKRRVIFDGSSWHSAVS